MQIYIQTFQAETFLSKGKSKTLDWFLESKNMGKKDKWLTVWQLSRKCTNKYRT